MAEPDEEIKGKPFRSAIPARDHACIHSIGKEAEAQQSMRHCSATVQRPTLCTAVGVVIGGGVVQAIVWVIMQTKANAVR